MGLDFRPLIPYVIALAVIFVIGLVGLGYFVGALLS